MSPFFALRALPFSALALALMGAAPALAAKAETKAEAKAKAKAGHPAKPMAKPAPKSAKDEQDQDSTDEADSLAAETEHMVKPGETLGGIANRAHVPRILIAEANRLKLPYHVHAGQRLVLPRTRRHTVKKGESGFDIAYQYGVPFSAIAIANGLDKDARVKAGQKLLIPTMLHPSPDGVISGNTPDKADTTPAAKAADKTETAVDTATVKFVWPVEGSVRRGFATRGSKSYHDGMDIIAKPDSAVRAAAAGTVIFAGDEPQSFGRLVVLDHGGGWQSAYGFLGKMTVKKGETVKPRERIGLVGHSGRATADELHFELRQANKPVDPAELLPAKPVMKARIAPNAKADSKVKAKKPVKG